MGRYIVRETTGLSDMIIPPLTYSFEIEDTKTGRIGEGAGYTKEEARDNAWKDLKYGEEPEYREAHGKDHDEPKEEKKQGRKFDDVDDDSISYSYDYAAGKSDRSFSDTGETFSYDTSGFGYVVLIIICVVIFFAGGLDKIIEKEVIKRTWPTYETRAEKVLKLKMEQREREMPLNTTPIQITKEILPVNVIHGDPFGTEMRPIRLSSGEKIYSLSRPKVDYGGPGGTIFIEGRYEKKLIADHTGFPCKGLAISPDETQIGYFLGTMRGATLKIIDKNGTPIQEFTHVFWGLPTFPSWSPDGRLIVFSVQSDDGVSGNDGVYIINIENGKIQRLTKNGSYPVWFPNGKRIAFDSWGTIYTCEIASGNVTKIPGQKIPDQ